MPLLLLVNGCGGSATTVTDNNNNLSRAIVIEAAANIPVLDGHATQTGVYVRNTTDEAISGISYALAETGSAAGLTVNTAAYNKIEA